MTCRVLPIFLTWLLAACATTSSDPPGDKEKIGPENVLNASPLAENGTIGQLSPVDILAASPEMKAFIDEHVDREGNQNQRLAQLVVAVISGDRFKLAYDDSTRTAQETFDSRRGNCVSFTNMFIAMARDIGLDALYQEVEIPPDWSMTGQTYLLSEHINVLVKIKNALPRVVDFNVYEFHSKNESREISDERARAHYFNNIGVELMLRDDTRLAFANLQQSLREDRNFASAWVNLGILHRREGYPGYAEVAYQQALTLDRGNQMAMSNLANLYLEEGREDEAQQYLRRVQSHRLKNPFYRYQLANQAFSEGNYDTAIKNLKVAIRQREDEDRFYYLLSLSYLMNGDRDQARRWMKKAEDMARQAQSQQKYHHKLDLLREQDADL